VVFSILGLTARGRRLLALGLRLFRHAAVEVDEGDGGGDDDEPARSGADAGDDPDAGEPAPGRPLNRAGKILASLYASRSGRIILFLSFPDLLVLPGADPAGDRVQQWLDTVVRGSPLGYATRRARARVSCPLSAFVICQGSVGNRGRSGRGSAGHGKGEEG